MLKMSDLSENISDYERLRQKNLQELEEFMGTLDNSELNESIKSLQQEFLTKPKHRKRKKETDDKPFRFTGQLPLYSRRSLRLLKVSPENKYTFTDDRDDVAYNKSHRNLSDLENIIAKPRKFNGSRQGDGIIVPVEEITDDYIANIAQKSTIKTYSQNGTSCHQCRQKTLDSKTLCRSGICVGVRGQFCGVCLRNRYGEDAAEALKDPNWACPPCRGLCNCSICRTKEGKCPTGILAPIAFRYGHKSVKDFLISLKGECDYIHRSPNKGTENKHKHDIGRGLLGFNSDLNPIWIPEDWVEEGDLIGFTKVGDALLTTKYF